MRFHHFVVAAVAVAAAGLLAASGSARTDAPGWNNPVKITNTNCEIGYPVVDAQYNRIVFGIVNNGTVAHGFDIGGPYKSGLIKPGQEKTLVTNFRPGVWKFACVARRSTVKWGTLTIR
jgi:hypothetical protein